MTPPQLAADAPVLYVFEPDTVCRLIFVGDEADNIVHHGAHGDVGKVLHVHEPLQRQARFYRYAGTFRQADVVHIVLGLLEQAGFAEVFGYRRAAVEAVHADVHTCNGGYGAVLVEDIDGLEIVGLAQHKVVLIVCRRNFQTARTELYIYISVFNYGDYAVDQRHHDLAAFEPCVLGVFGVDTHGRIAHDGLGAGGGNYGIVASVFIDMNNAALGCIERFGLFCKVIAQVI